jgi:microcystin-dependent protein
MAELVDTSINTLQIIGDQNLIPTGCLAIFTSDTIPNGWLLCNGQAISRSIYKALFSIIGTTYGNGDGSSTFNLPDLRQKMPMGANTFALGVSGGSINHTHHLNHTHSSNHYHYSLSHNHYASHFHNAEHTHTADHTHSIGSHTHTATHNHSDKASENGNSWIGLAQYTAQVVTGHTHTVQTLSTTSSAAANSGNSGNPNNNTANFSMIGANNVVVSTNNNVEVSTNNITTGVNNIEFSSNNAPYLTINFIIKV